MLFRKAQIIYDDIDRDNRSLPLVLATEAPIQAYDMTRMQVVDEVLRMDGMQIPSQIPLVDSHERESVVNVLGSIRELRVDEGRLIGRAYFASDPVSQETFEKYADGHLTDFSVGARPLEKEYQGKTKNVTRSALIEGSAVVIGADSNAKAMLTMRAYTEPQQLRDEIMDAKLKELLIERGLSSDASDKDILEFVERQLEGDKPSIDAATALDIVRQLNLKSAVVEKTPEVNQEDVIKRARDRYLSIDEICRKHGIDENIRREYIEGDKDLNEIAGDILERKTKSGVIVGPDSKVQFGTSDREKFYEATRFGLMQRALGDVSQLPEDIKRDIGERPQGVENFQYKRIPDIARDFCERSGERVEGLPTTEIVRRAIKLDRFVERSGSGQAYHTSGSFPNLLLDAMNKTLRASYAEAASTYQRWVRQAASASDFKSLNRIIFGEIGLPDEIEENGNYPEMTAGDSRESYKVAKHGGIWSISFEAMVNDDLDAMTRIPQMQGNAMRRAINRDSYATLVDNNTLADGVALFHGSSHGANLDATALAEGALDTGFQVMMTQAGLDSSTVLNIMPRFLIVPAALSATAYRLTGGGIVPETVGNKPLYGTGGPRPLEVIVDGQIDNLGSATNWWLAADNRTVDTVEITFLQGEETPVLDREDGFETDTIRYKIRQTYGIKPIDYRGLYQGNS